MNPFKIGFRLAGDLLGGNPGNSNGDCSIALDESLIFGIKKLSCDAQIALVEGEHALNSSGRAPRFGVAHDANAHLFMAISEHDGDFKLDKIQITFNKPLQLLNIFTTLDELSDVFADNSSKIFPDIHVDELISKNEVLSKATNFIGLNAKKYADIISDTDVWKRLKSAAEKGNIQENLEKSKEYSKKLIEKGKESAESALDKAVRSVLLSELEIVALPFDQKSKKYPLAFYISGHVALNDKLKRTFVHTLIPDILLPDFDARISLFLDQFTLDREQGGNIAKIVLRMIDNLYGDCLAELDFRSIPLQCDMSRDVHVSAHIHSDENISSSSKLYIKRNQDHQNQFDIDIDTQWRGKLQNTQNIRTLVQASADHIVALVHGANRAWTASMLGQGNDICGQFIFDDHFAFRTDHIDVKIAHDRLKDDLPLRIALDSIPLSGSVHWGIDTKKQTFHVHRYDLTLKNDCYADLSQPLRFHGVENDFSSLECRSSLHALREDDENVTIQGNIEILFDGVSRLSMPVIPEFGLHSNVADILASGALNVYLNVHMDISNERLLAIDFDGSQVHALYHALRFVWEPLQIQFEPNVSADLDIHHASCAVSGLSQCQMHLKWNLNQSPIMACQNDDAPLLPSPLVCSEIDASISEHGILRFSGGSGFYNDKFFNTFLLPNSERGHWLSILSHRPLYEHLRKLASALIFPHIDGSEAFVNHTEKWLASCDAKNLLSLSALVHPETLAYVLSGVLVGDDSVADQILPSILRVYQADGIDRFALESLFERFYPKLIDYVAPVLKLLNRLFQTVPYETPKQSHHLPLCDDPTYFKDIEILPTANEIYREKWAKTLGKKCAKYASGLNLDELQYILSAHKNDLISSDDYQKLQRVFDIKKRIFSLESREGTVIIQDFNIFVFLPALFELESHALEAFQSEIRQDHIDACFLTYLSPNDVATLISAGITSRYHGIFVQLDQDLILRYLKRRGRRFALSVFYELGRHSTRVLVNLLMSWLSQDQSLLKSPANRAVELSQLIGIDIPSAPDYEPWNEKYKQSSYIDALYTAADNIMQNNQLYSAACLRLRSYRTETPDAPATDKSPKEPPAPIDIADDAPALELELQNRIFTADAETQTLVPNDQNPLPIADEIRKNAVKKWSLVFDTAKQLIAARKDAFQLPIMKKLWARVVESRRVASIYDDIIHRYDETRHWFAYRTHINENDIDNLSLEKIYKEIVDIIYAENENKKDIFSDPLLWFMPPIPQGKIDLTIVTSMGIITNGANGHELETVFQRLEKSRGVRVVRSDTGTVRPLDYNADKIIEVIQNIHSPYVLIGYSQGCPNMLRAESRLFTGSPEKRKLLNHLVARCFICSAFNGSPHAICGVDKYKNALVDAEFLLKSFSFRISKTLYHLIFFAAQRMLDTKLIVASLASVESISHSGLAELARDAQYLPCVPSFEYGGYMTHGFPEGLVVMANHFDKQAHVLNDSQIGIDCAHGYSVYNRNDSVDVLRAETIPARLLNIHHWSPLIDEIKLIESENDINHCIYKGPKSLYVLPWLDALILFGIISADNLGKI